MKLRRRRNGEKEEGEEEEGRKKREVEKREEGRGDLVARQQSVRPSQLHGLRYPVAGHQEAQCVLLWPGYCYSVTLSMSTNRGCNLGVKGYLEPNSSCKRGTRGQEPWTVAVKEALVHYHYM